MPTRVLGGRYIVEDKVGTGGMAIVYRGLDQVLGRTVAIKTMLPQYATDASFAARFKQEAQAAAALQSPYIVSVYDWGKDNDTYYIVMEYLHGTDLKSGIRKHGALDCKKVAQIGSQIAQALSIAHRHDIIHRDIKPQNIMVQPDGNIKVMDFGIARAKNSHLTTDNSVLGTAHYISPEQTQGKEPGPTTDIYSLGIVMYEAATGSVPFDGDDAITVALKQVNEQPQPPSQRNPAVDPSLEAIILKCMQKDPANRFQTADELVRVLHDYLAGRLQAVNNATSVLPVTTTSKLGGVAPVPLKRSGKTAGLQSARHTASRTRQPTATNLAAQQQEERARQRKRNFRIAIAVGILAIAAIAFAVVSIMASSTGTQKVPNLLNYTQEDALQEIESTNWFELGKIQSEYNNNVTEGLVCDQDPAAGKSFAKGTEITIYISKGAEPAADEIVPNLYDLTASEAESALAEVNLVSKAGDSVYSSDVETGHVVSQDPEAGSTAKAGDTVTYQLSLGAEMIEIPYEVGNGKNYATEQIEAAGFTVEVDYESNDEVDSGYVIRQSPTGTATKGSTITITVSTGPETVEVPDVAGYSQSDAISEITNAGLYYNVETASSSSVGSGYVISQSPGASSTVNKGSTVTITVSTGPSTGDTTTDTTDTSSDETDSSSDSDDSSDTDSSSDSDDSSETDTDSSSDSDDSSETDSSSDSDDSSETDSSSDTTTG